MKAQELYERLEADFMKPGITDEWYKYMPPELGEFICPDFKERSIGLCCDFTGDIGRVYTAVFPSESVLSEIIAEGAENALLFLHHAASWDLTAPGGFRQMNPQALSKMRERRVSVFVFHHPLDNFGDYSTSKTLTDALGVKVEKTFAEFCGARAGVIGKTDLKDAFALEKRYAEAVGHPVRLYAYGDGAIAGGRVAVCAGGGNQMFVAREMAENGVNTLVTGLSVKNGKSADVHRFEEERGINVLGGTHYSSEKFASIAMAGYFEKLGIPARFVTDAPGYEDL